MSKREIGLTVSALNDPDRQKRLDASVAVGRLIDEGEITREPLLEVNNHIHTMYSFSPYYPSMAAFRAWEAGLQIVGSIDHDSISAADEMLEACRNIGIASTVGFELRCSFLNTPLAEKKINNPDSPGIVYMCVHGVPKDRIEEVRAFLRPINEERNSRNEKEVEALNELITPFGLRPLDFQADVMPLSRHSEGGSITERHILYALSLLIEEHCGRGESLVRFIQETMQIPIPAKIEAYLSDTGNPHYLYDLLGLLKGAFLPEFFIQPLETETIPADQVIAFARSIGAIPAYAYLGDITESPTGDKKAEKFEDSFLQELFSLLKKMGFLAVTYMPPRNTKEQLARVQKLAEEHGLMEISGVDINSSRQRFNCPELLDEQYAHLIDSAWALVAHEKLAASDPSLGLFAEDSPLAGRALSERIAIYAKAARTADPRDPDGVVTRFTEQEVRG